MKRVDFYECEICGNLVGLIRDGGMPLVCCEQDMKKLEPNTTDASLEKHVPVVRKEGNAIFVEVGSTPHPMTEQHYIEWIAVTSPEDTQRVQLAPGDEPKAQICCSKGDEVLAYCNLHGLWKATVE